MANLFDQFDKQSDVNAFDQFDETAPLEEMTGLERTGEMLSKAGDFASGVYHGIMEPARTIGSSIVAEPVAGLAGLGSLPFTDSITAEDIAQSVRQALTYQPRTKAGMEQLQRIGKAAEPIGKAFQWAEEGLGDLAFEATDSPLAGAAAQTIPTLATELLGLGFVRKGQKVSKAARAADKAADIGRQVDDIPKTGVRMSRAEPVTSTYEQYAKNLARKKVKKISQMVQPDDEILKAANDLGIELNPSAYSTNRAYIDMEQALKSRPGSMLNTVEEKAILKLGNKADDLIKEMGGTVDKSMFDYTIKNKLLKTIDDLDDKAEVAYKAVNDAIPPSTVVKPKASVDYIRQTLDDLGGNKARLTDSERSLMTLIDPEQKTTYAAFDRLRKDVGRGFRKAQGPFKDEAEGTLKRVYGALSDDQQRFADAFGVGGDYETARGLVTTRKAIEDQAKTLFGKSMTGSSVQNMSTAANNLIKGDVSKFNEFMKALPSNAKRQEAAATMLNDIFSHGARNKSAIGQGFVGAYQLLNRHKEAKKAFFSYLPKEAQTRFDNIGKVSTGLYKAMSLENKSRTARDVVAALNDGGLFNKLLGVGEKLTPVPGTGQSVVGALRKTFEGSKRTVAAEKFIMSPQFTKAIETSISNPAKAEAIIKATPAYQKWLTTVKPGEANQIMTVGFIPWLIGEREE